RAVFRAAGTSRLAAAPAEAIARRDAEAATPPWVEHIEKKTVREPPPLLFDLTALQRTANRRFGFSAQRTLQLAQALYEEHKLITYPRTDSRHLSGDLRPQLPGLFAALADNPAYQPLTAPLLAALPPPAPRRVFADHLVSDHHAIIPTPLG